MVSWFSATSGTPVFCSAFPGIAALSQEEQRAQRLAQKAEAEARLAAATVSSGALVPKRHMSVSFVQGTPNLWCSFATKNWSRNDRPISAS